MPPYPGCSVHILVVRWHYWPLVCPVSGHVKVSSAGADLLCQPQFSFSLQSALGSKASGPEASWWLPWAESCLGGWSPIRDRRTGFLSLSSVLCYHLVEATAPSLTWAACDGGLAHHVLQLPCSLLSPKAGSLSPAMYTMPFKCIFTVSSCRKLLGRQGHHHVLISVNPGRT